MRQIVKPCEQACMKAGEPGEESSCFTMCEAEMYQCHDHNHTVAVAEFQACHDKVVSKYEVYHSDKAEPVKETQFLARTKSKQAKTRQIVKPCAEACSKAGEAGKESSCYTMCEAEMF